MKGTMKLGDIVCYKTLKTEDQFAKGRLIATEINTDFHGSREWLYVRWFDSDGRPQAEAHKHSREELERVAESGQ